MESSRQLDVVGRATAQRPGVIALTLFLVAFCVAPGLGQATSVDELAHAKSLFDEQLWGQVVESIGGPSADSAELNYYYGSAAAQLGQWDEACAAFLEGMRLAPRDPRFPVELGGVAFREKRYAEAAKWLRRGLHLNPDDSYANDFLATVYFLNGNLEAALKYWNRIGQPQIEAIRPGTLRVNPELLDRAFVFAPASVMRRRSDYLTTQQRVEGLGIFSAHDFQLAARDDGKFDADFRALERNGLGDSTLQALALLFRGILWSTVYPEYYNIRQSAINLNSLVRWDSQKRRITASLSGPVRQNPKYRAQIGTDLRDENWDVRGLPPESGTLNALTMRREAADISFTSFSSGRWTWATGAEFSHRDYRNVLGGPALSQALLSGNQLKLVAQLDYGILRVPERRITTTLTVSSQTGSIWSSPRHTFEKLQGGLLVRWLPQMTGQDYATELQVRHGRTFGSVPFDELYMLGLERDTPLQMRAHRGTELGRKGNAPLGRNYFLANLEADKNIYERGVIRVSLSPFLDVGKITDPVVDLGSKRWLFDTGMQAKFRVWGIAFDMIYGKDLRSGRDAFYLTAGQ